MDREETDYPVEPRFDDDDDDDDEEEESGEDIMKSGGNMVGSEDDSSEEEDDDPEEAKRIAEGFIVDEDEEDGDDEEARRRRRKERRRRKRQEEEEEEELDEDDLALVAENSGKSGKGRQMKRFRRAPVSPDAEDDKEDRQTSERGLQHMFDDDDDDAPIVSRRVGRRGDDDDDDDDDLPTIADALRAGTGQSRQAATFSFEDEMDDFIDDDEESDLEGELSEGEREARREERRKKRKAEIDERRARSSRSGFDPTRAGIDAEAWAELNDVFGDSVLYDRFLDQSGDEASDGEGDQIEQSQGKQRKERKHDTRIEDVFEPSAIEARMMTAEDQRIKKSDFPERFLQLLPGDEGEALLERKLTELELDECARWVSPKISVRSNNSFLSEDGEFAIYRDSWFKCVRTMVGLVINDRREAMYLSTHRVDDYELRVGERIIDLLQRRDFFSLVSAAMKFKTLLSRRDALRESFADLSASEGSNISEEDKATFDLLVQRAESIDEVTDVAEWLVMRYGQRMRDAQANRDASFKRPTIVGRYEQLKTTSVSSFAARFGISALQLAENISGQVRTHFTEDEQETPVTLASQYSSIDGGPPSEHAALDSARTMIAYEMGRDPTLKREARKLFRESGLISVKPTDRGIQKIDDEHPYYNFKYLNRKPVSEFTLLKKEPLPAPAQYLMILRAEEELLVEVNVSVQDAVARAFESRLIENYSSEGYSETSRLWNEERRQIIRQALNEHLYPSAKLWAREWLREECWEYMGLACEAALTKRIDCQPYQSTSMRARKYLEQNRIPIPFKRDLDDLDDDESEAARLNRRHHPKVLAVSNGKGDPRREEIETIFVDATGRVREHVVFESIAKPEAANVDGMTNGDQDDDDSRPDPSREFRQLLKDRKPDVIVVSGFSSRVVMLRKQVESLVKEVADEYSSNGNLNEEQLKALAIDVIYCQDDVARLYQHSKRAQDDLPSLSTVARYCAGLARYVQSPVQQFAALDDEDLLALYYDANQHLIPRDRLLNYLERALVAVVNTVGVDINRCSLDASYACMLRYVSGLGRRKADALMRAITTQLGGYVVNRDALSMGAGDSEMLAEEKEHILPRSVWHNACSFLIINPRRDAKNVRRVRMQGSPDALDGTRIHPEAYEYARFIAFDALRKTEEDRLPDQHPSQWCEELMRDPERRSKVGDIDMADYERNLWAEMARQGQRRERKLGTLEFIARELVVPWQELRRPFVTPTMDDVLTMLTGETKFTFGKYFIVTVQVSQVKREFILVRFESGIEGTIHKEYLLPKDSSEYGNRLPYTSDLVKHGQTIKAAIIDIDMDNLRAELTARPQHLQEMKERDAERRKIPVDSRYFDNVLAAEERNEAEQSRLRKQNSSRHARFIDHPSFRNFKAGQAEEFLSNAPRGTAIVRPSSKGEDHLAVTWKVDENVYQHFDVQELDRDPQREIGRILRVTNVGGASYSDIDELLVSHVRPMANMVEMLMSHEKYHGTEEQLQDYLRQFSLANPNRSQYGFAIDKQRPGLFVLGFKANRNAEIQRWYVRVLPGRYKLNEAELPDMMSLCNAFKTQYTTRSLRAGASSGAGYGGGRTPGAALAGGMTPGLMRSGLGGGITPRVPVGGGGGASMYGRPISAATPNPYQYGAGGAQGSRPAPPGAPPVRPGPPPARPPQYGAGAPPTTSVAGIHPDRVAQMNAGGAYTGSNGAQRGGYQGW